MKNFSTIFLYLVFISFSIACKDDSPRCTLDVSILHSIGNVPPNSIVAFVSNGQDPYTYSWSNGSTNYTTVTDSSITLYSVTVTDAEGCVAIDTLDFRDCPKTYYTQLPFTLPAKINGRCWMDASVWDTIAISQVTEPAEWANQTGPAWCYYQNDPGNNFHFGKLFNWQAVVSGKICLPGYHVPTNDEWQELIDHLGGNEMAGKEMKDSHLWGPPFVGVPKSAFDAQPAGRRDDQGQFINIGKEALYWSSTETFSQSDSAFARQLINSSPEVFQKKLKKTSGLSCKCIAN